MSALNINESLIVNLTDLYAPLGNLQPVVFSHLDISNGFPGTVAEYTIQQCRQKKVYSSGEQNDGTLASENFTVWQITKLWLDAAGAPDPCLSDQFLDERGQAWNVIGIKAHQLMRSTWNLYCERIK